MRITANKKTFLFVALFIFVALLAFLIKDLYEWGLVINSTGCATCQRDLSDLQEKLELRNKVLDKYYRANVFDVEKFSNGALYSVDNIFTGRGLGFYFAGTLVLGLNISKKILDDPKPKQLEDRSFSRALGIAAPRGVVDFWIDEKSKVAIFLQEENLAETTAYELVLFSHDSENDGKRYDFSPIKDGELYPVFLHQFTLLRTGSKPEILGFLPDKKVVLIRIRSDRDESMYSVSYPIIAVALDGKSTELVDSTNSYCVVSEEVIPMAYLPVDPGQIGFEDCFAGVVEGQLVLARVDNPQVDVERIDWIGSVKSLYSIDPVSGNRRNVPLGEASKFGQFRTVNRHEYLYDNKFPIEAYLSKYEIAVQEIDAKYQKPLEIYGFDITTGKLRPLEDL